MRFTWPRLKPESEDFLHLDALRIIASLGIVAYHWRAWLQLDPGARHIADGLNGWAYFVDLFFVISGFVICHVYATRMESVAAFGVFLRKRLARLAPLHWLTLAYLVALSLGTFVIGHTPNDPPYDASCLAPNIALIHAFGVCDKLMFNYPSWSISAEMGCYLLFPLYLALYRVNVWLPGALSVALMAALTLAGPFGAEHRYWYDFTYFWGVLRALPAFGLGVTLYGLRGRLGFPFAGVAMYAALIVLVTLGQIGAPMPAMLIDAYLIVVLGVAADARGKNGALTRWLAPFGALTYAIYMLHAPIASTFSALDYRLLDLSPAATNVAVIAMLPLLFVAAYLSYALFETPARRWLSGRKARPTPAQAAPSKA